MLRWGAMLFIGVLIFLCGVFVSDRWVVVGKAEAISSGRPHCQAYMDHAVRAVQESEHQYGAPNYAKAVASTAWSAIYRNCMGGALLVR